MITLSPEQQAAATCNSRRVQVVAGAGTGKSTMLVGRYEWMITENAILPKDIVIVTFTIKAAAELRKKMAHLPPPKYIGTIHGYCVQYLQPGQSVASEELAEAAKKWAKDAFPKEKWPSNDAIACGATGVSRVYQAYLARLATDGMVDYDTLLSLGAAKENLLKNDGLHLIVDEYQDTAPMERKIYGSFASQFVVGDPRQTLYTFRGVKDWDVEGMKEDGFTTLSLTTSYRFPFWIADKANQIKFEASYPLLQAEHRHAKLTTLPWRDWLNANLKRSVTILCRSNREKVEVTVEIEGMGLVVARPKPVAPEVIQYGHWLAARWRPSNGTIEHYIRLYGNFEEVAEEARRRFRSVSEVFTLPPCPDAAWGHPDAVAVRSQCSTPDQEIIAIQQLKETYPEEGIKVVTVHGFKGLEDEAVCYIIPPYTKNSLEDRRLLYVAMTRTKEILNLDWKTNYQVAPTWIPC